MQAPTQHIDLLALSTLLQEEKQATGTTWTHNKEFDNNGYIVIKDLWNSDELYHPVPQERGGFKWYSASLDDFNQIEDTEGQVEGSLARYNHPQYRKIHGGIRRKLEKVIGRKLYDTYYYDRYYFGGQKLPTHLDRDACEISVTVHVSSNLKKDWAIWIKSPDGKHNAVNLMPGDGLIYKGCERPHWREVMPGRKFLANYYYHQIFFHYVLQDGQRAHCAWDMAR